MIAAGLLILAAIDLGGPLGERMVGPPREIDGVCYSACVLDAIRPGSCIRPGTILGVHATRDPVVTRVYRSFLAMDAPRLERWAAARHAFDSLEVTPIPYATAIALGVRSCVT